MSLRLVVVYGSVRSERQGIRAARLIVNECRARGHETALVDPLEYRLSLIDKMYKEYPPGAAPETLQRLPALIVPAHAIVVVSGEYNHSIPPALSNLFDHFLEEYFWKPSAIVCYSAGAFGGVRAAMQLRMMLAELGTVSIPPAWVRRRGEPQLKGRHQREGSHGSGASDRRGERRGGGGLYVLMAGRSRRRLVRLIDSTVVDNDGLGGGFDVLTNGRATLVDTVCGRGARLRVKQRPPYTTTVVRRLGCTDD